jgi:uracil-DNA glycosylase
VKPLIIGQAPARGNDGLLPFAGQSGARLATLAGVGTSGDDLPPHFDLANLLDKWPGKQGKGDAFDMDAAREAAADLTLKLQTAEEPRFVLLMGRKVERAFGWSGLTYLDDNVWHGNDVILFPHPSGVNLWWNELDNRTAARKTIRWVLRASK